jgi:predicted metalloprotease with PDZ domain
VVRVVPDSPAASGGLLPGDRIITLDGVEPRSQDDMLARLKAAVGGVVLNVERHGRIIEIRMMPQDNAQP